MVVKTAVSTTTTICSRVSHHKGFGRNGVCTQTLAYLVGERKVVSDRPSA